MEEVNKFILGEALSKESKNDNMSLNLNLSGNKRVLPETSIDTTVDAYDVYLNERSNSNKFRLTVSINPYCSNVLFNPFTEIVKYYKSGDVEMVYELPHSSIDDGKTTNALMDDGIIPENSIIGKNRERGGGLNGGKFKWNTYKAIRDTQLSNDKCGFEYYCGLDIFNNHVLRNKTYKSVTYTNKSETSIKKYNDIGINYGEAYNSRVNSTIDIPYIYDIDEDFNTIDDYMRDRNGVIVSDNVIVKKIDSEAYTERPCPLHLYQRTDVETFRNTVEKKLIEDNGWFGFRNKSLIDTSSINNSINEDNGINLAVNNKKYGEFIDMYPTRDLFTFSPLYNTHKKRLEKNWNYYLTYPSESITKMFNGNEFPFFRIIEKNGLETVALQTLMIDEYTVLDNGRSVVTIYSLCQHGLKVGDKVNIYVERGDSCNQYKIDGGGLIACEGGNVELSAKKVSDKKDNVIESGLFYEAAEVVNVYDKYIFQINKTQGNISNKWVDLNEETGTTIALNDGRILTNHGSYLSDGEKRYLVAESNRCNVDDSITSISFKRVVDNVECDYYVRVFSRLPNFKFADSEITDETLYGKKSEELNLIEKYSTTDFENHVSDESFARTSYGDNDTEIVFTDDIDISYLRDNLGRPLSDIFLTVIKNNKGYKEWYGIESVPNINDESIEMSHCFGKNNSSFLLSDYYRSSIDIGSTAFYDVRDLTVNNSGLLFENGDDEIDEDITKYYGDICCYSPVDCDEQPIQTVHNRFNTAQRELSFYPDIRTTFYNGELYYDELFDDESGMIEATSSGSHSIYKDFYKSFNTTEIGSMRHSSYSKYLIDGDSMTSFNGMTSQDEGYYYKTHYKIKLKTISKTVNSDAGISYEIYEINNSNNGIKIKTYNDNYLEMNDKLILYVKDKNLFYYLTVKNIITEKCFECSIQDEKYSSINSVPYEQIIDIENISLIKRADYVPYYANIIKDGSCRFYWRGIVANGIEDGDSKVYPFTNGAFYINKNINFYLKRQDPSGEHMNNFVEYNYTPDGQISDRYDTYETDIYYEADEIETC